MGKCLQHAAPSSLQRVLWCITPSGCYIPSNFRSRCRRRSRWHGSLRVRRPSGPSTATGCHVAGFPPLADRVSAATRAGGSDPSAVGSGGIRASPAGGGACRWRVRQGGAGGGRARGGLAVSSIPAAELLPLPAVGDQQLATPFTQNSSGGNSAALTPIPVQVYLVGGAGRAAAGDSAAYSCITMRRIIATVIPQRVDGRTVGRDAAGWLHDRLLVLRGRVP